MMNRRHFGAVLPILALGPSGLVGCGASAAPRRAVRVDPSPDAYVVSARSTDFAFHPPVIRMPVGRLVRLELTNDGKLDHDVMMHDLPVSGVRFPPGQHMHGDYVAAHASTGVLAWVEFVPGAVGIYQISCSVLGHREAGMAGTLIVE